MPVQFHNLASQQAELFFTLRPRDNLRAVEQQKSGSDANYQIAQETDARFGHGGEMC